MTTWRFTLPLLPRVVVAAAIGLSAGWAPAVPAPAAPAALVLENKTVRVVIDPAVGRIVEFRPREAARNVLWTNSPAAQAEEAAQAGYQNWGGDKVWPAAQPFWRYALNRIWPPDTAVDGNGAVRAEQLSGTNARLEFAASAAFHSRLERDFELDPTQPVLRIRNRVTQEQPSPFPAQVWSITQVPLPERVVFDVAADAPRGITQPVNLNGIRPRPPLGPQEFAPGSVAQGKGWVTFRPDTSRQQKLGTLGRWMAGVWPDGVLVQQVAFDAAGLYPEATSLQLYHNDRYAELETLGPARQLRPGEAIETVVVWRWLPPVEASLEDAAVARAVATALAPQPVTESPSRVDPQSEPENF